MKAPSNRSGKRWWISTAEHEIVGIGVSFPGHINHHTGEAAKAGALDYLDGENLCELFAQLTDLPVTTENDANCAALGERWQGAGKDYEHFVCITIGTGIGGGIVMEGDLYRGSHYRAGEFGVLPVGNNGEPMHEVASASGLMKACRRAGPCRKMRCLMVRSCLDAWTATCICVRP